ncbi:hypothetical protein EDD37DRAFT_672080 [Exophiala viscosa]|uniref:uncharacterized protein n=1 Tax=Exophiala viscosa TaxID=2486360 RepID=UPI002192124C|nr:hypothetical protein EDD37DRAFT_672080 [Exophiala viscosa]
MTLLEIVQPNSKRGSSSIVRGLLLEVLKELKESALPLEVMHWPARVHLRNVIHQKVQNTVQLGVQRPKVRLHNPSRGWIPDRLTIYGQSSRTQPCPGLFQRRSMVLRLWPGEKIDHADCCPLGQIGQISEVAGGRFFGYISSIRLPTVFLSLALHGLICSFPILCPSEHFAATDPSETNSSHSFSMLSAVDALYSRRDTNHQTAYRHQVHQEECRLVCTAMDNSAGMGHRGSLQSLPSFSQLIQGIPPAPLRISNHIEGKSRPFIQAYRVQRLLGCSVDTVISPSLLPETEDNDSAKSDSNSSSRDHQPCSPSHMTPASPRSYSYPSDHELGLEGLQDLISRPDVDVNALIQRIFEFLNGPMQPAYEQGWYRPDASDNAFSRRLEEAISILGRDELAEAYFFRQEGREPYGYSPHGISCARKTSTMKQTDVGSPTLTQPDPGPVAKPEKQQKNSSEQERRCRHRYCQMQSDLRCSEIAFRCGEQHARIEHDKIAKTRENGSKCQSAKGTGKDEQLFAAVYAHELSARIIQLEHDGRKRAETIVRLLCQLLLRSQGVKCGGGANRHLSRSPPHFPRDHSIVAGVKRFADDEITSRRCWTRASERDIANSSRANSPWKRPRSLTHDGTPLSPERTQSPTPESSSEGAFSPYEQGRMIKAEHLH